MLFNLVSFGHCPTFIFFNMSSLRGNVVAQLVGDNQNIKISLLLPKIMLPRIEMLKMG